MTLEMLLAQQRAQRAAAESRGTAAKAELDAILARAQGEGRSTLTPEEQARTAELFTQRDAAKAELAKLDGEIAQTERAKQEDDAAATAMRETKPAAGLPAYDQVARVGMEARTYRADNDRKGKQFLRDLVQVHRFGAMARDSYERMTRHAQEDQVDHGQYLQARAVGTGNFAGLTVPQYLTEMYAPATAALRPFADICTPHELPAEGMTVNISRITTASSVALQAAENDAVSETNMDDTLLTENVQTAAGQQTLSRQAVERGTGIEDVTMRDLFRRYATDLDSTLITQATTGLSAVAQAIAYTDGTPTAAELYPKLLNGNANVEAALLAEAMPTHAVMHSRRWNWLQSQVGTSWPFMTQPGIPTQAGGVNFGAGYGKGVRGILPNGNLVVVDNNIATNLGVGTNEDEIFVVPQDEMHLWEDPAAPMLIRTEAAKAANLGILIVVYGYFAYSFRRYTNAVAKIGGTGLITPTF